MSVNKELSRELRESKRELQSINEQMETLRSRKRHLKSKIESLETRLQSNSETQLIDDNRFKSNCFEWSQRLQNSLETVFKLKAFRSHQLVAINATLSRMDVLLVMPTGGGKSLCFQLPALLDKGLTVVVSPLISLMEDQMRALEELNISTAIINSQTSREETNRILKSMTEQNSDLKIVYVTPEKMAKSKRFMSQMEKCYENRKLNRIVIDEAHCCSQWGHDFRPDYQFLRVMKTQFPETPILGLTATATFSVIADIQKILNIEGCILLKDSFFRSNLKYTIERIGSDLKKEDQIQKIANLLKTKYANQSGIIYCLTIKEVEDLTQKLKGFGIKANGYHAQLDSHLRSAIHQKWYQNKCQVIVATVAFGMGINKLDVRFVIHFSMSKSLENYYQETGRAGRDGKPADCLLFYKFNDIFRTTSLVFSEKNGLANVYAMLAYSLNHRVCRKEQIAVYFGDKWSNSCDKMCDNCINSEHLTELDVTQYLNDIIAILSNGSKIQERMTALKLIDSWFSKGPKKLRSEDVEVPNISRSICEEIIGLLLVDGYLKEEFHFTPYSTISYLTIGSRFHLKPNDMKVLYHLKVSTNNNNNNNNNNNKKRSDKQSKESSVKKQKVINNSSNSLNIICID